MKDDNKLYAQDFIPHYSKRETRSGFSIRLIHFKVDSIAGEKFIVEVKTLLNETMSVCRVLEGDPCFGLARLQVEQHI